MRLDIMEIRPKTDFHGQADCLRHHSDRDSQTSDYESNASGSSDDSEMEPFSEYLPKIEELLRDIGLCGFNVEPIQHSYTYQNCVYGVKSDKDENEHYILRVPNYPDFGAGRMEGKCESILNDISLSEYLADKLPVSRIKAYCATTKNALGMPFTVQTRLPGQSLNETYKDLSHAEKLAVIDQVVELLAKLETITFTNAGTFTASPNVPDAASDFSSVEAPAVSIFDAKVPSSRTSGEGEEGPVEDPRYLEDRAGPDVKALLVSHLNGFITAELEDGSIGTFRSDRLRPLLTIIEDLDHEGAFKDGPYPVVLHHWDLEPRNIMVEKSSGTWKISGVIDWDEATCVPQPLARRPPEWIWDFEPEMHTGYLDNDHDPSSNILRENMALKAYFDDKAAAVLPGYLEDAYGHGRWLRRIWTFARTWICQAFLLDRAGELWDEWKARPKKAALQYEMPTIVIHQPEILELNVARLEGLKLAEPED